MTSAESTNYAKRYLQKAVEFLASAQDNFDLERAIHLRSLGSTRKQSVPIRTHRGRRRPWLPDLSVSG
jgi:hypothetical protein